MVRSAHRHPTDIPVTFRLLYGAPHCHDARHRVIACVSVPTPIGAACPSVTSEGRPQLPQPRPKATTPMTAIKKIRKYLAANPTEASSRILVRFVLALETEESFLLADLYRLDYDVFKLALELLDEWRLDRYYTAKGQLLDMALHLSETDSVAKA
jgi:hypothetical protein